MADPVKEKQGEQAAKDKALASKASKQWTSMKMEPQQERVESQQERVEPQQERVPKKIQQGTEDIAEGVEQLTGQSPTAMQTTAVVPAATIDRIEGDMAVVDIGGTTHNVPVAVLQALGIQAAEGAALSHSPPPAE